jgi:hypothetical protein
VYFVVGVDSGNDGGEVMVTVCPNVARIVVDMEAVTVVVTAPMGTVEVSAVAVSVTVCVISDMVYKALLW